MKKNLIILAVILLIVSLFAGAVALMMATVHGLLTLSWFRGVVLLGVFILAQIFRAPKNRESSFAKYVLIVTFIFFTMFLDLPGNELYNKPLEWIVSPLGVLNVEISSYTFMNATYINTTFSIVQPNGEPLTIPLFLMLLYRIVQYYFLLLFVYFVNEKTLVKLYLSTSAKRSSQNESWKHEILDDETRQEIQQVMNRREFQSLHKGDIPPQLYKKLKNLKEKELPIAAIKLLRDETKGNYTLTEAKKIVETL